MCFDHLLIGLNEMWIGTACAKCLSPCRECIAVFASINASPTWKCRVCFREHNNKVMQVVSVVFRVLCAPLESTWKVNILDWKWNIFRTPYTMLPNVNAIEKNFTLKVIEIVKLCWNYEANPKLVFTHQKFIRCF